MSKHFQYLVEGITSDIICFYLEEHQDAEATTAINDFYQSQTFLKLTQEETGLFIESSSFVYELYLEELKYGRL